MNWLLENIDTCLVLSVPVFAICMMMFMYRVFTNQVEL